MPFCFIWLTAPGGEGDAVLLDARDDLSRRDLHLEDHVADLVLGERPPLGDVGRRLGVADEMGEHLVLNLHEARRVLRCDFVGRRERHQLVAGPEDLFAGLGHQLDGLDSRMLLGLGRVDALDSNVRVRAADDHAVEHSLGSSRVYFARPVTFCGPSRVRCASIRVRLSAAGHW